MGRLFGKLGFNLGFAGSLEAPETPLEGYPLEQHPDWRVLQGIYDTKLGWRKRGETIFVRNQPVSGVKNLAFKSFYLEDGYILGTYLYQPMSGETWTIPFAKMVNGNNIIGARILANKVEIVQRRNGTWATRASTPVPAGSSHWVVHITNDHVYVEIDGVPVLDSSHAVPGPGYFGISMHKFEIGAETDFLENYKVFAEEPITYRGELITYNQKIIKDMAELFNILAYEKSLVASVEVTAVDPDWLPINQLVTQEKEPGDYEVLFSMGWSYDVTNKSGKIRFSLDGGSSWEERSEEPKDKTDKRTSSIILPLTLTTAQTLDIQLEANKEGTDHIMTIHHSLISIQRVK